MKSVVTIGLSGFPFGMAATQKLFLMGKALIENGSSFTVISNSFIKKTKLNEKLQKEGEIESVKYLTTSPYIFSPKGIIKKLSGKFLGYFNEFLLLNKLRKKDKLDAVVIYSMSFTYTAFYGLFFKLFKIPTYLVYFELRASCTNRKGFLVNINDKLLDTHVFKFVSGVITISENLVNQIRKHSPSKRQIIVPPLVNFDDFVPNQKLNQSYFLYCGTLAYAEVVEFIIDSYSMLQSNNCKLFLILNGSANELEKINKKINECNLQHSVNILSNLKYEELVNYYTNATALLIPLRNTPQDISRFPQKVAEYCASKSPIISNRVGEISKYFDDNSIVFSEGFDKQSFADKMKFVLDNRETCNQIALNAYKIGEQHFNYKSFSKPLYSFLIEHRA